MLFFFADDSVQRHQYLQNLIQVFSNAGISSLSPLVDVSNLSAFPQEVLEKLEQCSGAVCMLSSEYGPVHHFLQGSFSLPEFQFRILQDYIQNRPDFKLFIWYPPNVGSFIPEPKQSAFISLVRNALSEQMTFSNVSSPIEFADDVRQEFSEETQIRYDLSETEVFFISNQLDEADAAEVLDMLGDVVKTHNISIVQNSDTDYAAYCTQQISKSRLAVVYFKTSSDWALPFTQEIWKRAGGASMSTPILLIGDTNPEHNRNVQLKAPRVLCMIIDGILIPLEIKVQYEKAREDSAA
jgi:hypothetical protein